jgi:lipopolysaccharide export system protein LptA
MRLFLALFPAALLSLFGGYLHAETQEVESPTPKESTDTITPHEKTVITSDQLDVINTEKGNQFIFSGSVKIAGSDFIALCDRMEVRTDSSEENDFGAISVINAIGNVTIRQGDRIATAGKAVIYPEINEVILEDQPTVRDGRGTVSGYRMILHGADRKITVERGPDGEQPRVELPTLESIRDASSDE